jgi:transposase InsO family protein
LAYRAAHRVGPHRIGWALGEAHSTVHAVLARHQVPRLWELDRPTGQVVRYQRQRPGELVHVDVKKQGRIPDGGGHRMLGRDCRRGTRAKQGLGYDVVHAAVDDCSRVAYLEVHPDEGAATVAGFTQRALAFYAGLGVSVERVLTDNGNGYRSAVFGSVLAAAGVTHKRTRPYRPQSNGKVDTLTLGTTGPRRGVHVPSRRPPYRPEFRAEAVRLVRSSNKLVREIAATWGSPSRACATGFARPISMTATAAMG